MLRLIQQIGCEQTNVARVVGNDQALGRRQDLHAHHAVALNFELRAGHGWATGAEHLAAGGDRFGPKCERCHTRRSVGTKHVAQPELLGHHQHCRVDLAVRAGDWWHDDGDLGYARHDSRRANLDQHAGEGALATRHKQTGTGDGCSLLADHQTRLELQSPVAVLQDLFVKAT